MYKYIDTESKLKELILQIQQAEVAGLDIEATSLDTHSAQISLIQISLIEKTRIDNEIIAPISIDINSKDHTITSLTITDTNVKSREAAFDCVTNYVIPIGLHDLRTITYLIEIIKNKNILVVGHNLKYDIALLYRVTGVLLINLFDTMIAETLIYAGVGKPFYKLSALIEKYFNVKMVKEIRKQFIDKVDTVFTEEQLEYAADDVKYLIFLAYKQSLRLVKTKQIKVWPVEMELEPVVMLMEYTGIELNVGLWEDLSEKAEEHVRDSLQRLRGYIAENFNLLCGPYKNALDALKNAEVPVRTKRDQKKYTEITTPAEIKAIVTPMINHSSPKQVKLILDKLGLQVESTSVKAISKYRGKNMYVTLLLEYRDYYKKSHAFGMAFLKNVNKTTGKIHTSYNQLGAKTGRFASEGPNLQNILSLIAYRRCFIAGKDKLLLTADFSQMELRIMAEVSQEKSMIEAFQKGIDLHTVTAATIFEKEFDAVTAKERKRGKTVNFAIIYGVSAYGLARQLGLPLEECKKYLELYFDTNKNVRYFMQYAGQKTVDLAYSRTVLGRNRLFVIPKLVTREDYGLMYRIRRQGVNHIVQGTAGDILKIAMCKLFYNNPFGFEFFRLLLTVHDEIVAEIHKDIKIEAHKFVGKCLDDAESMVLKQIPTAYTINIAKHWSK